MHKVRYLNVGFDRPLMAYELPYFRASVIENTKRQSDLFHNHVSKDKVIYRYPLIQYKIINRKPHIICINAGTDDIHFLLDNDEFHFDINGKIDKYEIESIYMKYWIFQTWNTDFHYHLHNYMPFNQEHYQTFKKLSSIKHQIQFIEEMLTNHFNILIKELNPTATREIPLQIEVTQLQSEKFIEYKSVFHQTFCLNIKTNISLPNFLGIGKGVSQGFGLVKKVTSPSKRARSRNSKKPSY